MYSVFSRLFPRVKTKICNKFHEKEVNIGTHMACYHTMHTWKRIPVPSTQVSIYKKSKMAFTKMALKANSEKQNRKVDGHQGLG